MKRQRARVFALLLLALAGSAAAADIEVDSRQIFLPVGDVSADPAWSLFSGNDG